MNVCCHAHQRDWSIGVIVLMLVLCLNSNLESFPSVLCVLFHPNIFGAFLRSTLVHMGL